MAKKSFQFLHETRSCVHCRIRNSRRRSTSRSLFINEFANRQEQEREHARNLYRIRNSQKYVRHMMMIVITCCCRCQTEDAHIALGSGFGLGTLEMLSKHITSIHSVISIPFSLAFGRNRRTFVLLFWVRQQCVLCVCVNYYSHPFVLSSCLVLECVFAIFIFFLRFSFSFAPFIHIL